MARAVLGMAVPHSGMLGKAPYSFMHGVGLDDDVRIWIDARGNGDRRGASSANSGPNRPVKTRLYIDPLARPSSGHVLSPSIAGHLRSPLRVISNRAICGRHGDADSTWCNTSRRRKRRER